jgi:hypothetical protein
MGEEVDHSAELTAPEEPTRGVRSFLGEVGIIVLGVLLALLIGEVANAIRQRVEANRAMEAVRADMIDNSSAFEVAPLYVDCANRRLDAVSQEITQVRRTGRLRNIGEIGIPGATTLRSGSWESAVANRDTLFIDAARIADLTDYHELLGQYRALQEQANLDWARLGLLTHAAGSMDENTMATVRQTVVELRYRTKMVGLIARLLLETHQGLGFPVVYAPFNGVSRTKEEVFRSVQAGPFCQRLQVEQGTS